MAEQGYVALEVLSDFGGLILMLGGLALVGTLFGRGEA